MPIPRTNPSPLRRAAFVAGTRRRPARTAMAMLAALLMAACGGNDERGPRLELALQGLEDLGPGAVYEGWLVVNGAPVSTGRFSVDAQGRPSQTRFRITQAQADSASTFVLTVEPSQGDVPAPSDSHLLAGTIDPGTREGTLGIAHPAALGTDFSQASGSFLLATPTSESLDDESQGLWWIELTDGAPQAGLDLPTLPAGWVYEGWVVVNGQAVSTGRFTQADGADLDAAGPAAGPLPAPPFPGQDFVDPARRLPGGTAVVSIEPEPDPSPAPFTLKPLAGPIVDGLPPGQTQALSNTVGSGSTLPRGTARLLP